MKRLLVRRFCYATLVFVFFTGAGYVALPDVCPSVSPHEPVSATCGAVLAAPMIGAAVSGATFGWRMPVRFVLLSVLAIALGLITVYLTGHLRPWHGTDLGVGFSNAVRYCALPALITSMVIAMFTRRRA